MAVTTTTYSTDTAVTATNWDAVAANDWATLPIITNTAGYMDILIGGQVDIAGTSWAAGESFDIYVSAYYDIGLTTSGGGGIDTAFTANDATIAADVEFNPLNLTLIASVVVEATAPTTSQGYNWNPVGLAQFFGGVLPYEVFLVGHCNSTSGVTTSATSTNAVNYVGITYTSA